MIRPVSSTLQLRLPILLAIASVAYTQTTGGTQAGIGNAGPLTPGSVGPLSGTNPNLAHASSADPSRTIFLSGSVLFDDGTAPNNQIRIERFCTIGGAHLETHTDSKGHFSFQVGGEQSSNISEADSSSSTFGGRSRSQSLMGCVLRAAYPGYVSDTVDLSLRHELDDSKVGTLVLHRMEEIKGSTVSATSAEAPKSAQKNYEKGILLLQKSKFDEAAAHFASATAEYPKYAEAWVALGETQERLNKPEEAKKSFLIAAAADSHYVSPYDMLARLCALQKNWPDAAKYSKQVTDLNPIEFPSSFWYNALSNFNLKNNAEAERSALALVKIDTQHRYPDAETMLAEFAANRGDLEEAAARLKAYLSEAPNSKNAELMKGQLARVEAALSTQAKSGQAPQGSPLPAQKSQQQQ